jgi:hypothetical protein
VPTTTKTRTELSEEITERGSAAGVAELARRARARPVGAARRLRGPAIVELSPEVRDRLSDELIDELLAGAPTEEEIVGPGGLLADLTVGRARAGQDQGAPRP